MIHSGGDQKQEEIRYSPRSQTKSEVNKILHHVDLDSRSRNNSIDGFRYKQIHSRQSNGNSPRLQNSQSSPKFQGNNFELMKQLSSSSNSLSNLAVHRSSGAGLSSTGVGASTSANINANLNRYNNFHSFSPLQQDSIQEEYFIKNPLANIQMYQQNAISLQKYTPDKRRFSQSPSPFKISELQTTQFNINSSGLDVKNSRAYLKAMKALQSKVKEVENQKQGEIEVLKETLAEREEQIKILNLSLNEEKLHFDKLEKRLAKEVDIFNKLENNLKEKLKTVEKENDEYVQHCNFYKSEIESLKGKVVSVEQLSRQEMKGLLKEKSSLKEQINYANSEEQLYQQKLKELQMQNKHLLENMESLELKYRHMESSFKQQMNDSEQDIKHSLKSLQFQLLDKDDQIKRLRQDNFTLNSDIELTRQKFDEIKLQLEEEQKKNKSYEEENKQLSEKINEIIKDNENMRSFCQATREMNNKLLNSFSTSRLNESQGNQMHFKSGNQYLQHSLSHSGNNFQISSSFNETPHHNPNGIIIHEEYIPNQQKNPNRNSSSTLLQTISNVAAALPASQKQITINETNGNGTNQLSQTAETSQNKDKYYLNQGLSYTNYLNKKDERKQSLPHQRESPQEDNQEQIKQNRYTQSSSATQIKNNNIQSSQQQQQLLRSQGDEITNYNYNNMNPNLKQKSFGQRDSYRNQRGGHGFSEQKDKNSQETFRTTAQLSVNYQENNQLKSRYEYEQVIQAVLDTEKHLVELNHTYQKLAEDIYNFEGDEIYITVLKKKMLDMKDKIEKKQDFLDEMKARESVLAQSILSHHI